MQDKDNSAATSRLPSRRWPFILGGVLLAMIVGTVSWSSWRNREQNRLQTVQAPETHYGVTIYNKATEEKAGDARQSAIARVKTLRESWRQWAWQNRAMLIQMRTASPDDDRTLMRVYDSLPLDPGGGSMSLLGDLTNAELSAGGLGFTWQPLGRLKTMSAVARVYPKPEDQAREKIMMTFVDKDRQQKFAEYRDIELSKSLSQGTTKLTLWVSGRVTEQSMIRQFTPGQRAWIDRPVKTLLPSYDFLDTAQIAQTEGEQKAL